MASSNLLELAELPNIATDSKCTYNGSVLSIQQLGLDYQGEVLFDSTSFSLERGYIYGLVARNGSGKTSLCKVLASKTIPGFPSHLTVSFVSPESINHKNNQQQQQPHLKLCPQEYILQQSQIIIDNIQQQMEQLENELESISINDMNNESRLEEIATLLGELDDTKETMQRTSTNKTLTALNALGFVSSNRMTTPIGQLSSGWKYKCELACAMVKSPDLLLMDEPSFLDQKSIMWLIEQLQYMAKNNNNSIIVLISHKAALLDAVANRILYIHSTSKQLSVYNCSYTIFLATHAEQVTNAKKTIQHHVQESKKADSTLNKIQSELQSREKNMKQKTTHNADKRFIKGKAIENKQKADKSAASKVKQLKKQAQELQQQEKLTQQERSIQFQLPGTQIHGVRSGIPILTLDMVSFSYDGNAAASMEDSMVLKDISGQIMNGDRILLQGANGEGKSTLVQLLLSSASHFDENEQDNNNNNNNNNGSSDDDIVFQPTSGSISKHAGVHIAYFPQTALSDMLLLGQQQQKATTSSSSTVPLNAMEFMRLVPKCKNVTMTQLRNHLGRFGLLGNTATRPIQCLSSGQRVRLWLAREFYIASETTKKTTTSSSTTPLPGTPSLLILDEVSENLDQDTLQMLLTAIESFEGAVLSISHDEFFCKNFKTTQIWTVRNGYLQTQGTLSNDNNDV